MRDVILAGGLAGRRARACLLSLLSLSGYGQYRGQGRVLTFGPSWMTTGQRRRDGTGVLPVLSERGGRAVDARRYVLVDLELKVM
ncbi:hypothetical protein F5X68DRAFT_214039 [Plectosphaerella plurivora]|uniref:Uncharacterized protein n=1 Tax=Plectosphaerella plurivora TaxID=936078 RepID=A0A9P8V566_9PEZI|nr:hypothetical protein F5X68DRAFT_214039 [Plectosphaerella plurivora]